MDALLERELREKTREKQEAFPALGQQFIQELYKSKSVATVFEYTKDIAIFFDYLADRLHTRSLVDADFSRCDTSLYLDFINALSHFERVYRTTTGKLVTQTFENGTLSKNRKVATLKSWAQFLYKEGIVMEDVSSDIEMVYLELEPPRILTNGEVQDFLSAIQMDERATKDREKAFADRTVKRDLALTALLLYTGCKIQEALSLKMNHIAWEQQQYYVQRKPNRARWIPIPLECLQLMEPYWTERVQTASEDEYLFKSLHDDKLNPRTYRNACKKYQARTAIQTTITPEVMRETFEKQASLLLSDKDFVFWLMGKQTTKPITEKASNRNKFYALTYN
jgi:site-specific recombinase XerD